MLQFVYTIATMSSPESSLAEVLKANGLHVTNARKQVFLALHHKEPQSMNSLYQCLKDKIDRTSIYRTIALFEKLHIINKIYIGWKYKIELSDAFSDHHHHISCLGCGTIIAVKEDHRIEHLIAELAKKHNIYRPTHQLEIQGYCKRCIDVAPKLKKRD